MILIITVVQEAAYLRFIVTLEIGDEDKRIMITTVNAYNLIQSEDRQYVSFGNAKPQGKRSTTVGYEQHCAWYNNLYKIYVGFEDAGPTVSYTRAWLKHQINTQTADEKNRWFPIYVYIRLDESDTQWVAGNMAEMNMYIWGYVDQRYGFAACQPPDEKFLMDSPNRIEARQSVFRLMIGSNTREPDLWGPTRRTDYGGQQKREDCAHKNKRAQGLTSLGALKQLNDNDGNADARFFLAIQMVEAARFKKYSADRGIIARPANQVQNLAMIALKDNWARMHFVSCGLLGTYKQLATIS
uniref:rRNA N-glycosylase n=1 Tax=Amaranthus tricolor TaxID=29722 RepID=Q6V1W8_AMATR|nr:antiviral/ribosome-inactivating protein [Amaranthus tricolor]